MISDVDHHFQYLLAVAIGISLWKTVYSDSCPFLNWILKEFCCWSVGSLHILDINPISSVLDCRYVSPILQAAFSLLVCFLLLLKKLFSLKEFTTYLICFYLSVCLRVKSEGMAKTSVKGILPMFFFRGPIVSGLLFKFSKIIQVFHYR